MCWKVIHYMEKMREGGTGSNFKYVRLSRPCWASDGSAMNWREVQIITQFRCLKGVTWVNSQKAFIWMQGNKRGIQAYTGGQRDTSDKKFLILKKTVQHKSNGPYLSKKRSSTAAVNHLSLTQASSWQGYQCMNPGRSFLSTWMI